MPNKNYRRGARAEYELMNKLKSMGMTVIRASGSHGAFDIIALDDLNNYDGPSVYLIQIKSSTKKNMSKQLSGAGMESIEKASPKTALPLHPYKILAERLIGNKDKKWSFKAYFMHKLPSFFKEIEEGK